MTELIEIVRRRGAAATLSTCLALAGCASPSGTPPELMLPESKWAHAPNEATLRSEDLALWWKGFHDEELSRIVDEVLLDNLDLKAASARVRQARAAATVSDSVLWPTLQMDGFGGRNKDLSRRPIKPAIGNIGLLGASAQWELDLMGGNRSAAAAAGRQFLAAEETSKAVRVLVLSEAGTALFAQRGVTARLDTLKASVAVAQESLRLVSSRYGKGLATAVEVDRALAQLKSLEAQLPALAAERLALGHRLAVLQGRVPKDEPPSALALPQRLPAIPGLLPSEWLAARPDLRAARRQVEAAAYGLASARSNLFPKFVLAASLDRERVALQGLPAITDNIFALGLGLVQPIFNAGRIRAQIEVADGRLAEAAAEYDRTLLAAVEDVENAFVAYSSSETQQTELRAAMNAARHARESARSLYDRGLVDYAAYLDAERAALAAQDALIRAATQRAVALISLYRAFGGGLHPAPDTALSRAAGSSLATRSFE